MLLKKGQQMKRKSKGDKLRQQVKNKIKEEKKEKKEKHLWVPSGSVLFNLACSDRWYGSYKTGTMVNIVGDSSSGKSIMTLSGMAAAANMPEFADYRFIYDDAEFADSFDHEKLFGSVFANKVESPAKDKKGNPKNSTTIEQFYDYVMDAIDKKIPFIYCLDSFDAIDADDEIKKELQNREHRKKGNLSKIKGSFQATKQKKASQLFRLICSKLPKTNSLLLIISQTRDNLSAMSFATKYRAGGKALKFYASIEAWLAYKKAIPKTVNGKVHKIGVDTIAKIEKNKYTGKRKEANFPIYHDYGIDDISSCIDFLIQNDYWEMDKTKIIVPEFDICLPKKKLINFIEEKGKHKKRQRILFESTQKCWDEIEDALKLKRRSKF